VKAYYDLAAAQGKYRAHQRMFETSQDIIRQIEVTVKAGMRYKSDLLLAKSNLNNAKIQMSKAKQDLVEQSNQLMNTLNIESDSVVLVSKDSVLVPVDFLDKFSLGQLDSAYQQRPEIRQVEHQIRAFEKKKKKVTTGYFIPNVNAGVFDGLYGSAFSPEGNRLNINAGIHWNLPLGEIFYGGQRKEYEAAIQMNNYKLQDTRNTVRQEVLDAYKSIQEAELRVDLAKEQVEFASDALRQNQARQEVGIAMPLEVFEAQEYKIEAQINYLEAVADYNKAQYAFYVAVGNTP
jgi:outer membrane protein